MPDLNCPVFFLGATSPKGFRSFFETAYDPAGGWRVYILKGGPGTGKSSLLKKTAQSLIKLGKSVWISPCSSSPASLDAVVLPDDKIMIADGTAPHVIEPKYPGVCEITVNLGDHYDAEKLYSERESILPLFAGNAACHDRVKRYIAAAGSLVNDCYRIALDCTDAAKTARFAASAARRELPAKGGRGHEDTRLLSALTPAGPMFFEETVHSLCSRVIAVEDEYGAASRIIMSVLRSAALSGGYSIITCPCVMAPDECIDHILIPELSLAFCTSNRAHRVTDASRRIHSRRFTNIPSLRAHKQRLSFNRRAVRELTEGACEILREANDIHDELEKYYIGAMDFGAVDKVCGKIVKDITKAV